MPDPESLPVPVLKHLFQSFIRSIFNDLTTRDKLIFFMQLEEHIQQDIVMKYVKVIKET